MTKHPDGPLTEEHVEIFIDNPKKRHVLLNGSDTSRTAWRVIKWQHYRLRDANRRIAELEAKINALTGQAEGEQTNWTGKVAER